MSNSVSLTEFPDISAHSGLVCGTTTRTGGVSLPPFDSLNPGPSWFDDPESMEKNREIIAQKIGWDRNKMVFCIQTHSSHICFVTAKESGAGSFDDETGIPDTDALYTETSGLLLCVVTADCHPILVADPKRRAIAAVHAGWKGAFAGIASKTVKLFLDRGSSPKDLIIAHGPGIEACCYGVSEEYRSHWLSKNRMYENCFSSKNGQPYFDLRKAIDLELTDCGVEKEKIYSLRNCTCCHEEKFYSYRRDGERTGRMMNFIGMRD
jgi:YfiH family protein